MKIFKIACGCIILLVGLAALAFALWLAISERLFWDAIPFFCASFLILFLGYDLVKGRSIKDDLFFLFFN
jgi:membrane protein implicated in regulation of membrane protease activity